MAQKLNFLQLPPNLAGTSLLLPTPLTQKFPQCAYASPVIDDRHLTIVVIANPLVFWTHGLEAFKIFFDKLNNHYPFNEVTVSTK